MTYREKEKQTRDREIERKRQIRINILGFCWWTTASNSRSDHVEKGTSLLRRCITSLMFVLLLLLLLFVGVSGLRIFQGDDMENLLAEVFGHFSGRFQVIGLEDACAVGFLLTFEDQMDAYTIWMNENWTKGRESNTLWPFLELVSLADDTQSTKRWVLSSSCCHGNLLVFSNNSNRTCSPETSMRTLTCLPLPDLIK